MRSGHAVRHPPRVQPSIPLVQILEDGVRSGALAKSDPLRVYTGFSNFSSLLDAGGFVPMNGNRAVNRSVVASRVNDNLRRLRQGRNLADFGQIILVVVLDGPPDWLVMDGQHRLEAMKILLNEHAIDVHFQFRVRVVDTEAEAREQLILYQDQYPPDSRTFLEDRAQTALAERVLERLRTEFPSQELWSATSESAPRRPKPGVRAGDPPRPYLTDNILLGIMGGAGLLRDNATVDGVMLKLTCADEVLQERTDLGKGVTDRMRQQASSLGCYLGFLRDGKLGYDEIRSEVETRVVTATAALDKVADMGESGARKRSRIALDDERSALCRICEDRSKTHLFQPCGHHCACGGCADTIMTGSSRPRCPFCRALTTGVLRVWDS